EMNGIVPDEIAAELKSRARNLYAEKEKLFGAEQMREIERVVLLRNVDTHWMDHLDVMDDVKGSIGLNAYAQRNPISEYRIAAADLFDEMVESIKEDTVRMLLSVQPRRQEIKRVEVAKVTGEGFSGGQMVKKKPVVLKKAEKVGRNDPCPCGSGKKYKKCHGANMPDDQ
ncbi:MAG: SEC-C domain-containing protein, partial [Clostridia bacterium]|nr:SEC-C domain-containing protein [Clostridia bacterium]